MASALSGGASSFAKRREQGRNSCAPPIRAHSSTSQSPIAGHGNQEDCSQLAENPGIAHRRQLKRQAMAEELYVVGPPIIMNPDELPLKKRSIPTLIEKAQKATHKNPGEEIAALASQIASFHCPSTKQAPRGTFDDTDSIITDDTLHLKREKTHTNHLMALASDYNKRNPASNMNLNQVSSDHANEMRGQIDDEENESENDYQVQSYSRHNGDGGILGNWQAEVDDEKRYRGITLGYNGPLDGRNYNRGVIQVEASSHTPTQPNLSSPVPFEMTPTAPKRAFEESLDHNHEQLATRPFSDFDAEPFLASPGDVTHEPAHDWHGVEPTLEQKLSKMTDMSEDQCRTMFAAMTDGENEGTGQWFIAKMKEDMEKLMRAKHRRRMIAAKYEHEVKKRNALVTAKTEDVEDELRSMKSGLGSLMPMQASGGR